VEYVCGFKAVNSDHCWINGSCVVCSVSEKDMQEALNYIAQAKIDAYKYGLPVN